MPSGCHVPHAYLQIDSDRVGFTTSPGSVPVRIRHGSQDYRPRVKARSGQAIREMPWSWRLRSLLWPVSICGLSLLIVR
jgi:hypothetical protein